MKIGFVIDDSMDRMDGVQQYVFTLGNWFSDQGHEVHYLTGETRRGDIENLHSMSRNLRVKFNRNQLSMPVFSSKRKIKELLESQNYDVLHVQMPYSPFMGGKIISLAKKPTIVVGTFHIYPYSKLHKYMSGLLSKAQKRSLKRFDQIFSVSEPAQNFSETTFKITSSVLPNVINIENFSKSLRNKGDEKSIVFLGRLVERKGCGKLLKAYSELLKSKKIKNVHLYICGKGPQDLQLKKFVKQSNLEEYVTFTGFVSEQEKIRYLANADIAVFPSLGGESFGIVLLEAMAAGSKVVIGGDNKGYSSVLGAQPITLFDPGDTKTLANLLYRLLSEPKLIKTIHEQQQLLVKNFDVNIVGRKLLGHYLKTIEKTSD